MKSYSLYDPVLFSGVELKPDTCDLKGGDLKGDDLVHFNRLLLEDYYGKKITRKGTLQIYRAHNCIRFHTWGNKECCLAKGATGATLKDCEPGESGKGSAEGAEEPQSNPECFDQECPPPANPPAPEPGHRILRLKPGDFLLLEEVKSPVTGQPEDADPGHRHVVRLTKVIPSDDQVTNEPLVEVEWSNEDALPFSLCISALERPPSCRIMENISVARGNLLLTDHGGREEELLGTVQTKETERTCLAEDLTDEIAIEPAVFSAQLKKAPLTFSQPVEPGLSASRLLKQDPKEALSCLELYASQEEKMPTGASFGESEAEGEIHETKWSAVPDLLSSNRLDRDFVAEMDEGGLAHLRFGDGELGRRPEAGTQFRAVYRIGNGPEGNVGRDVITHIVFRDTLISGLDIRSRNPLPASGGTAREKIEDVKLMAPYAFRQKLQRAITADDYALLAQGPGVQRAACTLRWTGSWHEAMIAVDPLGIVEAEEDLLQEVESSLYPYRRMGHDMAVKPAHYVALDIELTVCVLPSLPAGPRRGRSSRSLQQQDYDRWQAGLLPPR